MKAPILYENYFYSSYTLQIENLSLTVTLDGGICTRTVRQTPLHSHPVFELQAVLNGELSLDIQDADGIRLKKNEICLLPPDLYHGVSPTDDTERLTLRFSLQRLGDAEGGEDLHARFARLSHVSCIKDAEAIIRILECIRAEAISPMAASDALCRAYFSELFILLFRRLGTEDSAAPKHSLGESDDENARYNKIEFMMQQRMAELFREEDLAEALGLSVRQTSRVMQRIFGMSFRKKLLELRLHFAKGLLVTTDQPVDTIAATVGYTSPSGFHIAFKKAFGLTPSEYREANIRPSFNSRT